MTYIIGLTGPADSGKSTAGSMIQAMLGDACHVMAFADPLKRFCKEVFDFGDDQLHGALKEVSDVRYPRFRGTRTTYLTPREAMQTLGSDWGRKCYENVWAELGMRTAKRCGKHVVVLTDVRFINEAAAILGEGGAVVGIYRDVPALPGVSSEHDSEREMGTDHFQALITHRIDNAGTLADLSTAVRTLLDDLGLTDRAVVTTGA